MSSYVHLTFLHVAARACAREVLVVTLLTRIRFATPSALCNVATVLHARNLPRLPVNVGLAQQCASPRFEDLCAMRVLAPG